MVRLLDVAGQAGVSEATVSRALSGKPGVSEETRRAVLAAADAVGYSRARPHASATRRAVVGIVVPELENPVFATFAQQLTAHVAQTGGVVAVPAVVCSVPAAHAPMATHCD